MRQFATSGFRIWNLAREAKLVYTAFGLCSLLALASTVALYEDMVGPGTPGIRAYYNGNTASDGRYTTQSAAAGSRDGAGGPEIALPDEGSGAAGAPITVAVSYRKLLEVTHFHLFTVPVFLLIIAHLFMLTGLGPAAKMGWIAAAWIAALGHLAAPWAVHLWGGSWRALYAGSGAALALTTLVLTAYPIWAMWFGRPRRAPDGDRDARGDHDGAAA